MAEETVSNSTIELLKNQSDYCVNEAANCDARARDYDRSAQKAREQAAQYRAESESHLRAVARLTAGAPA